MPEEIQGWDAQPRDRIKKGHLFQGQMGKREKSGYGFIAQQLGYFLFVKEVCVCGWGAREHEEGLK